MIAENVKYVEHIAEQNVIGSARIAGLCFSSSVLIDYLYKTHHL